MFLGYISSIYLSPFVGNFIDGFKKNKVIACSNLFLGALLLLYLFSFNTKNAYLMLFFVFVSSLLTSAISLSLSSSVSTLFKKDELTRVNGLVSVIENSPLIAGPAIGAALYSIGVIDYAIYASILITITTGILFYRQNWGIEKKKGYKFFGGNISSGFRFIKERKDLFFLQLIFSSYNFFSGISASVIIVYVISFPSTWGGEWNLAANNILSGAGILLGGTLIALLGKRINRRYSIVGSMFASSLLSRVMLPFVPNIFILLSLFFTRSVLVQFSNAPLTSIWQERVPKENQGTVFGARRFLGQGPYPLALILGGTLANFFGNESIIYILFFSGILEFLCALMLLISPAKKSLY